MSRGRWRGRWGWWDSGGREGCYEFWGRFIRDLPASIRQTRAAPGLGMRNGLLSSMVDHAQRDRRALADFFIDHALRRPKADAERLPPRLFGVWNGPNGWRISIFECKIDAWGSDCPYVCAERNEKSDQSCLPEVQQGCSDTENQDQIRFGSRRCRLSELWVYIHLGGLGCGRAQDCRAYAESDHQNHQLI